MFSAIQIVLTSRPTVSQIPSELLSLVLLKYSKLIHLLLLSCAKGLRASGPDHYPHIKDDKLSAIDRSEDAGYQPMSIGLRTQTVSFCLAINCLAIKPGSSQGLRTRSGVSRGVWRPCTLAENDI
jgi:hypothetical protein